ncbi:MAG TPA: hypothetical protein DEB17_09195 [Chlorobaculum sp.]|uniref:Uncharacterized protein n=1 Tax=Chlorobaculum tepidum (strain ATCC 49652 / DSM 12025 / NBRC 103806 / TLS) TaxID=194439 RepID=Q8KB84_CHLTE|nr:hypothetical protein CT1905 [Chlorobaculum tepidum TLS]HBU24142.1 hypothetical protein [Chlorobaculum sp.]
MGREWQGNKKAAVFDSSFWLVFRSVLSTWGGQPGALHEALLRSP